MKSMPEREPRVHFGGWNGSPQTPRSRSDLPIEQPAIFDVVVNLTKDARYCDSGNGTGLCRRGDRMNRRDFVGLIGTTTFAIPFVAGVQQVPVIGFLFSRTEEQAKDPVRSPSRRPQRKGIMLKVFPSRWSTALPTITTRST
jgi:hypothetical protein